MKSLKLLFAVGTVALTALACTNEEDEAHFASLASISTDSPYFTADETGGTLAFKAEGGQAVFTVDCGTDWAVIEEDADWLSVAASVTSGTLTVSAGQNLEAKENTAVITLQTSESGVRFATINVSQNAYGAPEITVDTHEWHAPAVGTLTTQIGVEASDDWSFESSASWLTVEKSGSGISLTAASNTDTEERSAEVVLTCTDGVTSDTETVTVTQDGKAYINASEESLSFTAEAGSASVTVESNFDWTYTASDSWITLSVSGNTLTVKAAENETEDGRECTLTLAAGDGAENVAETQITVTQAGAILTNPMILTYTTTDAATSVQLPISGTVDCTVDWGDGSTDTVTAEYPTHSYAEAGEYDVTITGTVTSLNSYNVSKPKYLTAVKQWGATGLTSMKRAFYDCSGLTSLPEDNEGAFDEVTTFDNAFQYAYITQVPDNLFAGVSKATTFEYVFQASHIEKVPAGLFSECTAAEDFSYAFANCTYLTAVEGKIFPSDPTSITNVNNFFYYDNKLTDLPEGLFEGCSQLTAFKNVFYYCSALTGLPNKLLAGCSGITTFENAFYFASGLKSLPEDLLSDCVNAENFNYCFCPGWSAAALETVPVSLFDNCKKITSMYWTFMNCSNMTGESPYTEVDGVKVHLYERSADNGFSPITTYGACFMGCTLLSDYSSIPGGWLE